MSSSPSDDFTNFFSALFGERFRNEVQAEYMVFSKRKSDELELRKKELETEYASRLKFLELREKELTTKAEQLQNEIKKMEEMNHLQDQQIKLDVGGIFYTTSIPTLTKVPGSMLEVMFSGRHHLNKNEEGRIFIDRNGKFFEYILDYLRNGEWDLPKDPEFLARFHKEIDYYGLKHPTETTPVPDNSNYFIYPTSPYLQQNRLLLNPRKKQTKNG